MHPEPPEKPKGDWIHAGENLWRRKASGVYYVFAKQGGKQFRRSLKTHDKAMAKRLAADFLRDLERLAPAEASQITFAELAARWIDAERHTLKESSAKRRADAAKAIAPAFSGLQIRNITAGQCEEWAKKRAADSAAATFVKELDTMRGAFRYAVAHGLILRDPSANVKRQRIRNKRPFVPTREQFAAIVAAIREDPWCKGEKGADMVEFLAYSGMRLGEARELRWRDVNFAQGVFTVTGGERGTKNHEQRTVPLSDSLRALLERIKRDRGSVAPGDCILRTASARKCLDTACRKLGLQECTHHALRHYFATVCVVDNGIPIPTVAAWLGHKDGGALLMKRYAHVLQAESKAQMKRVSFKSGDSLAALADAGFTFEPSPKEPVGPCKYDLPPSPLGHPAPATPSEGEDSGAGTPTP